MTRMHSTGRFRDAELLDALRYVCGDNRTVLVVGLVDAEVEPGQAAA